MKAMTILIKSEFRKAYAVKHIAIFIIIFLLFDCINTYRNEYMFKSNEYMNIGGYELTRQLEGELTEDKLSEISVKAERSRELNASGGYSNQYDADKYYSGYEYGDAQLWIELDEKVSAINTYSKWSDEIALYAAKNSKELNNAYLCRVNEQIEERFSGRSINALYNTDGFYTAFQVHFSSVLIILLIIIGACSSYTSDTETGMNEQVLLSTKGGTETTIAKISAMISFSFFIVVIFSVCDFIMLCICDRPSGFSQPIYAVTGFKYSAFAMPIWCMILLVFILRVISICTLGNVFLLLAKHSRSSFSAFVKCTLFIALCAAVSVLFSSQTKKIICCFDPLTLLQPKELFEGYSVIRVFSHPMLLMYASLFGNLVIFVLLCAVNVLSDRRRK